MRSESSPPIRRWKLATLALVAALGAGTPVLGEDRQVAVPPDDMVEFLLVMDAMDTFGDAIDLETELEAQEDAEEKPRPSGEGGG